MKPLFTILFDPSSDGNWRLFDRVFYLDPSVALDRCDVYNRCQIFERYKVAKVDFTFLD